MTGYLSACSGLFSYNVTPPLCVLFSAVLFGSRCDVLLQYCSKDSENVDDNGREREEKFP